MLSAKRVWENDAGGKLKQKRGTGDVILAEICSQVGSEADEDGMTAWVWNTQGRDRS